MPRPVTPADAQRIVAHWRSFRPSATEEDVREALSAPGVTALIDDEDRASCLLQFFTLTDKVQQRGTDGQEFGLAQLIAGQPETEATQVVLLIPEGAGMDEVHAPLLAASLREAALDRPESAAKPVFAIFALDTAREWKQRYFPEAVVTETLSGLRGIIHHPTLAGATREIAAARGVR